MKQFKVGDKVKRVTSSFHNIQAGSIYIIENITLRLKDVEGQYDPKGFELVEEPQYPNPPHKHRDLIIAWAEGADIEIRMGNVWFTDYTPNWGDNEYRIKPTRSAKDIEIESIQAEMAKLQERMEKLKEGK